MPPQLELPRKEPRHIARLKDYSAKRLSVESELLAFDRALRIARHRPTFKAVESLCKASRSVTYAIDERLWWVGASDPRWKKQRIHALKQFAMAVKLRDEALAGCSSAHHVKLERFFSNITARRSEMMSLAP